MKMNVVMVRIKSGKGMLEGKIFPIEAEAFSDGRDAVKKAAAECGIPENVLEPRPCPLTVLDEDSCLRGWTDEIEYEGIRYKFLIEHDSSVQAIDPFDEE